MEGPILNLAFYRFARFQRPLTELQAALRERAEAAGMRGTVLLSPEGINGFLAGPTEPARAWMDFVREICELPDLEVKESFSPKIPFKRLFVKIKKEIIALGDPTIDPLRATGRGISPQELRRRLDAGEPVLLVDTRNTYETKLGTFENAIDLELGTFRQFPAKLARATQARPELKKAPVVMFCTGGIRCEKATAVALQQGFENVYQLEGGILRYFEREGGAHWKGDCFVFDRRVTLRPDLSPGDAVLCYACRMPLNTMDVQSPAYVPGVSCPHCAGADQLRESPVGAATHAP